MDRKFLLFLAIGLVVIGAGIYFVFSGTKGAHLELTGSVLKGRLGKLDESRSGAILDFRVSNPADLRFVVREVTMQAIKADGQTLDGGIISKRDIQQIMDYNQFFRPQFNPVLSLQDRVDAHQTIDRMVAAQFEVPLEQLSAMKALRLTLRDLDGPEFTTEYQPK